MNLKARVLKMKILYPLCHRDKQQCERPARDCYLCEKTRGETGSDLVGSGFGLEFSGWEQFVQDNKK